MKNSFVKIWKLWNLCSLSDVKALGNLSKIAIRTGLLSSAFLFRHMHITIPAILSPNKSLLCCYKVDDIGSCGSIVWAQNDELTQRYCKRFWSLKFEFDKKDPRLSFFDRCSKVCHFGIYFLSNLFSSNFFLKKLALRTGTLTVFLIEQKIARKS